MKLFSKHTNTTTTLQARAHSDAPAQKPSRKAAIHASSSDRHAHVVSMRVKDIDKHERRAHTARATHKLLPFVIAIGVIAVLLACSYAILRNSNVFSIQEIQAEGVNHLTSSDMTALMRVNAHDNLLTVDTRAIARRLERNSWIERAQVSCVFPHTLRVSVKERSMAAVVELVSASGQTKKLWAIASDKTWLMPLPQATSDAGKRTNPQVFADASSVLKITHVALGVQGAIGQQCTDSSIINALDIATSLTTDLAKRIVEVRACTNDETSLVLDNGIEIAFGQATHMRDKERVVLEVLSQYEGKVSYINVRNPATPTWRAIQ